MTGDKWMTSGRARLRARQNRTFAQRSSLGAGRGRTRDSRLVPSTAAKRHPTYNKRNTTGLTGSYSAWADPIARRAIVVTVGKENDTHNHTDSAPNNGYPPGTILASDHQPTRRVRNSNHPRARRPVSEHFPPGGHPQYSQVREDVRRGVVLPHGSYYQPESVSRQYKDPRYESSYQNERPIYHQATQDRVPFYPTQASRAREQVMPPYHDERALMYEQQRIPEADLRSPFMKPKTYYKSNSFETAWGDGIKPSPTVRYAEFEERPRAFVPSAVTHEEHERRSNLPHFATSPYDQNHPRQSVDHPHQQVHPATRHPYSQGSPRSLHNGFHEFQASRNHDVGNGIPRFSHLHHPSHSSSTHGIDFPTGQNQLEMPPFQSHAKPEFNQMTSFDQTPPFAHEDRHVVGPLGPSNGAENTTMNRIMNGADMSRPFYSANQISNRHPFACNQKLVTPESEFGIEPSETHRLAIFPKQNPSQIMGEGRELPDALFDERMMYQGVLYNEPDVSGGLSRFQHKPVTISDNQEDHTQKHQGVVSKRDDEQEVPTEIKFAPGFNPAMSKGASEGNVDGKDHPALEQTDREKVPKQTQGDGGKPLEVFQAWKGAKQEPSKLPEQHYQKFSRPEETIDMEVEDAHIPQDKNDDHTPDPSNAVSSTKPEASPTPSSLFSTNEIMEGEDAHIPQDKNDDHTPDPSNTANSTKPEASPTPSSLFSTNETDSDSDDEDLPIGSRLSLRFFNEGAEVDTYGNPLQ